MALTVTNNLTVLDDMETDNSVLGVLDTDFYFTGSGSIAVDTDIETQDLFNGNQTAVDMSGGMHLYVAALCMTQPTLDTKANGGLGIIVKDSSGNISGWYVGGKDTYSGGWEVFSCNTGNTPDYVPGSATNMSDIVAIGFHFKCLAKSKLTTNCFMDRAAYGNTPVLKITGTNAVTDVGWPEVLSVADSADATRGYMKAQTASYILKGPVQIGDDSGTLSTAFSDDFNEVVFGDQPVSATHYAISGLGNSTGTTAVTLKNNICKSAGERFGFDFNDTNLTSFSMTGSTLAKAGLSYFKSGQTVTGNVFNDCLQIDPGTATFQNTISNSVDTGGALLWPTSGNTSDCPIINCDKGIEITQTTNQTFSGMIFDDEAGNYDVHLNNGGTSIEIAKTGGSNPNSYTATGGGVVTFTATFVFTITNIPNPTNVTIVDSSTRTELQHSTVTSGTTTYSHNGGGTIDVLFNTLTYDPNLSDIYDLTLPNSDSSAKVQMVDDVNYVNA